MKTYRQLIQEGLCPYCRKPNPRNTVVCKICTQKSYDCAKRKYHRRIANGECVECGFKIPSGRLCAEHLARRKQRTQKYKSKKIANGICVYCPNKAVPKRKMCQKHLNYVNSRTRDLIDKRLKENKCTMCGQKNDRPEHHTCSLCKEKQSKRCNKSYTVLSKPLAILFGKNKCTKTELKENKKHLRDIINDDILNNLNDRQKDILYARFLNENGTTLREVGEKYNVSRERIRQVEESVLMVIQKYLTKHTL